MKRSEINRAIRGALEKFREYRIALPPFVLWKPEEWRKKGAECDEICDNMLGWDITDFGRGDFEKKSRAGGENCKVLKKSGHFKSKVRI